MKIKIVIIILFFASISVGQRSNTSIGGGIGLGSIFGNFPSQTTMGSKLFVETLSPLTIVDNIQFHFTYAQRIEKFIPGSFNYEHYSYFYSFGISGIFNQVLGNKYFIEEGIGIMYTKDRTFDDIDIWNYGILINFSLGYELNNNLNLTANMDSGLTLVNTNISYILFHLGVSYNL